MELKALQVKYEWRVLSHNGILEQPRPSGPAYDESTLNEYGGFASRVEAIARLEEWVTNERNKFGSDDFVLIEVFGRKRD
jgi:hypothetical protein